MRKKLYMCFGVLVALSLAGCGAGETAADPAGETTAAQVTIEAADGPVADGAETAGTETAGAVDGETDDGKDNGKSDAPAPLTLEISTEYENEWKDDKSVMRAEIDRIAVPDGGGDSHKELQAALEQYNKENLDYVMGVYDDEREIASEYFVDGGEGWYIQRKIQIVRADEAVVSLWNTETAYLGGAHGSFYMSGETFDSETGAKMELSDVVTDMDRLYEYVKTYLAENYDQEMFFEDYVETSLKPMFLGESAEGISPPEWTMDQEKLTFIFNPYVLGPWASGSMTVELPFEGNEDLIQEK